MTFALIVKTGGFALERRPFVAELTRDCPKTLFTKTRWGENRHNKDLIRYRLFDTEEDARAALPQYIRALMEGEKRSEDELRRLRGLIDDKVSSLVAGDDWSGGR